MHIEFLLEERSAEAFLDGLLPRVLPAEIRWRLIVFQGKNDLLRQLPSRLQAYRKWLPPDWRLFVLVDQDREDCRLLKARLEKAAADAGLRTKTAAGPGEPVVVVNRIAVEELEAWFFGDVPALCQEFPGVPATLGQRAPYREPDAIAGGTWEALERVLQEAGHYQAGLPKIDVARRLGRIVQPQEHRSTSFRCFLAALETMVRLR